MARFSGSKCRGWLLLILFGAGALFAVSGKTSGVEAATARFGPGPSAWEGDLRPIMDDEWNEDWAAHLLGRAGFGGTLEEVREMATQSPTEAVARLVNYQSVANDSVPEFEESGVFDPTLDPFPKSRAEAVRIARTTGESMGVAVKPGGSRPLQPVVNRFFYWLRADLLEMKRAGQWWGQRMLVTERPLQEKLALFWHGHFATSDTKVRDYRKLVQQLRLFWRHGNGNFRDLLIGLAQDPAMLVYLDAGENIKGSPNENFGREVLELFTMGVGNYTESDIREASRAFTGWTHVGLNFEVDPELHDSGPKTFLGRTGNYDGIDIIDIILDQTVTAEFIARKVYAFFVREDPSSELVVELGHLLQKHNYELRPLLQKIFLSRDFYCPSSYGTQIKSPVHLVVSTYRKLGLREIPGIPDFNTATGDLGQQLFYPPNVAGWSRGRSWVTPALLLERGNFARDVLFPDMVNFHPPDRWMPVTNQKVAAKIDEGFDITTATIETYEGEETSGAMNSGGEMTGSGAMRDTGAMGTPSMSFVNSMADADEDYNTRYGSTHGWQKAFRKIKPISRHAARLDFGKLVVDAGLETTSQAVDYFLLRLLRVQLAETERALLIEFLDRELGTTQIHRASTFLDEPIRRLIHLIMVTPEYQLG